MEIGQSLATSAYVQSLAAEAKRLQLEARGALEQGNYSRATALLDDAELLADDVHHLVSDIERRDIGGLAALAAYDVREAVLPLPSRARMRLSMPSRRIRVAIGTSLLMSLALTEW